jgi:hypothetical protein
MNAAPPGRRTIQGGIFHAARKNFREKIALAGPWE